MSEDIHKWTDGRYTLMFDEHTFFVWDNEKDERMTALNVTKKLNEQQSIIEQLEKENKQLLKKQCNHKKAILGFFKFMKMDNPLMEIMIDEFLEEVYDYDMVIDDE